MEAVAHSTETTPAHAQIRINLESCVGSASARGVWVAKTIRCPGAADFRDENPALVVEVLSPRSRHFDRSDKFDLYETLAGLEQYVLVSQDLPRVEVYTRRNRGQWLFQVYNEIGSVVNLSSIGSDLPMSAIYREVEFPADSVELVRLIDSSRNLTPGEYLDGERLALERSEYLDGTVWERPWTSVEGASVSTDLVMSLGLHLRGRDNWWVFPSSLRVHVPNRAFFYPYVSVVDGKPVCKDDDCLLNPVLIGEVLSDRNEEFCRTKKFEIYKTMPTLRYYLLAAGAEPLVELFSKDSEGAWQPSTFAGLDSTLRIDALGVSIPLREIYGRHRGESA